MAELTVMSDFADRVKEKIKRDFAGMIPDDTWDKLVKDAVDSFIKTDLQTVVKAELTVEVKKRLDEIFYSADWQAKWDCNANGGNGAMLGSDAVNKILADNIPLVIQSLLGSSMQYVAEQIRYRLTQH